MSNHTSSVYVIGAPELGPGRVKIGYTNRQPSERLADLQTGSPTPLRLLYWTEGNVSTEHVLHAYFSGRRIHGEWFDFGQDDPVAEVAEAVRLLREAVEPYDPNRRMILPPVEDTAQQRYEDRRDAAIAALILHGAMGMNQLARFIGLPGGSASAVTRRMKADGIVSAAKPDKPGGPEPLIINPDHPAVLALLP